MSSPLPADRPAVSPTADAGSGTRPSTRPSARLPGLDGLRALAVILVVVYHLFPQWWFAGGFIGVDVFFVISGFLITTLLLRERDASGRISLVGFWRRRARRLLPALILLLLVCSSAAWLIGGDVLVRLGAQIVGALTFSYNWIAILIGEGYFGGTTPELFRNLWSLGIEEQFYVLWPLILPVILVLPRAWARVAAVGALAAASTVWMGELVATTDAVSRAYYGTDSHAFGILLGVALAFGLHRTLSAPTLWMQRTTVRRGAAIVGGAAVLGLIAISLVPPTDSVRTFPLTIAAASILSAIAIVAAVWPHARLGPALDARPLRWIGERSYGLYLWHWPLLVLLVAAVQGSAPEAGVPVWVGLVTLALTVVIAEASYRFLETPVRRAGFRGTWRAARAKVRVESGALWGSVVGDLPLPLSWSEHSRARSQERACHPARPSSPRDKQPSTLPPRARPRRQMPGRNRMVPHNRGRSPTAPSAHRPPRRRRSRAARSPPSATRSCSRRPPPCMRPFPASALMRRYRGPRGLVRASSISSPARDSSAATSSSRSARTVPSVGMPMSASPRPPAPTGPSSS
ncbi:acyltransferase [Microbacterium schleiferi]|uniref:Acyltransferase n=1 Tax=Microbacterium schleiferi TaxID=69362 RepID=A0A7S8MX97_9MICO|nr:acyltransferase [Microbacterium schleiferi]QPE04939.1 acyltransferase [Microbacterium schleiferi]